MQREDLFLLLSSMLLTTVCSINYSLIYPFFADYSESRGVSIKEYSLVIGFGDGAYVLGIFMFPIYKKYRLRNLHFIAFLIASLSNILFGLCYFVHPNSWFVATCLLLRMMSRISLAVSTISSYCIMTLRFSHRMATVLGLIEMSFAVGQSLGPIMGGFIYDKAGYLWPFFSLALLNCTAFTLTAPVFYKDFSRVHQGTDMTVYKLFSNSEIFFCFLQVILLGVTSNFYSALFSSYLLNKFGLHAITIGLMMGIGALINSTAGTATGHALDSGIYTKKRAANVMWLLIIGYICIAPPKWFTLHDQLIISVAAYFILNPGTAVCYMFQVYSIYEQIISMGYGKDNVIVYLAFCTVIFTGYSFGFMISGLLIGHMYQYLGFDISAYTMAVFIFLSWSALRFGRNDSKIWKLSNEDDPRIRAISVLKDFPETKMLYLDYQTFG